MFGCEWKTDKVSVFIIANDNVKKVKKILFIFSFYLSGISTKNLLKSIISICISDILNHQLENGPIFLNDILPQNNDFEFFTKAEHRKRKNKGKRIETIHVTDLLYDSNSRR